jgi:hypothetical protein
LNGEIKMRVQTQINEQGILTLQVPQALRGKQVIISIIPTSFSENADSITAWQKTLQIINKTNELEINRKSHDDIISELRTLRESE